MDIIELAKQAGFVEYELDDGTTEAFDKRYARFATLVAAHERKFISEQWEERYGYDKHGVAEFIRKRANTQEEQT